MAIGRNSGETVRMFLCGDLMTGRGLDQVLSHPVDRNCANAMSGRL